MGARPEELIISLPACAPVQVDATELRSRASHLRALGEHCARQQYIIAQARNQVLDGATLPGMYVSAVSAAGILAKALERLRHVTGALERLAGDLLQVAGNYEESESHARRLLEGLRSNGLYGRGVFAHPLPILGYLPGVARTSRQALQSLPARSPRSLGPLGGSLLLNGAAWSTNLLTLTPVGLWQYGHDVLATGRLLPVALAPVRDSAHPGINRAQGAQLSRALSGVVAPGGDIGEGAALVTDAVGITHWVLGHRQIRMERIQTRPGESVRTFAGALAVMEELKVDDGTRPGELRIDEVVSAQGETSWQVFIPGGQGFDPANVHSLIHAPTSVDGGVTPSVAMVAAALREVGAKKGEPIVMVGHSHGGITGSMFAADPRLRAEFDVPLVITAGSPIDRHDIRPDTHVVAIEHTEDFVPGLDGVEHRSAPGLTRIERTLADSSDPVTAAGSGVVHAHDYPNYVATAALVDEHPDLAHLRGYLSGIIPAGQVQTHIFRGEITR